jgi:YggT family protein
MVAVCCNQGRRGAVFGGASCRHPTRPDWNTNMTLSSLVVTLAQFLTLAIILRTILSWFPLRALAPVAGFLETVTEPVLQPIRRRLPRSGALDFSPMLAVLLIWVAETLLLGLFAGH